MQARAVEFPDVNSSRWSHHRQQQFNRLNLEEAAMGLAAIRTERLAKGFGSVAALAALDLGVGVGGLAASAIAAPGFVRRDLKGA